VRAIDASLDRVEVVADLYPHAPHLDRGLAVEENGAVVLPAAPACRRASASGSFSPIWAFALTPIFS
jgi:hypothetical protein